MFAQKLTISGQPIQGPLSSDISTPANLINKIVYVFIIPLAGVILFLMLIWGGYDFLLSKGNPEKVKSARARITTALIGFVLLILAYLIVRIISMIFQVGQGLF